MSVLRYLLFPWWVAQIFTTGKSFRDNPILGSAALNRLGLHVARIRTSQAVMRFKWRLLAPLAPAHLQQTYEREGYLVIPGYLPPEHFAALRRELSSCDMPVRECRQGDTLTLRVLLDEAALDKLPACRALVERTGFISLLRYCAGTMRRPMIFIQSIKNRYVTGAPDPQKSLHSDTFHPTMKAWLFLEDVTEGQGPLTFVPRSHLPLPGRLAWERRQSLAGAGHANSYSARGSLRLTREDLAAMGLGEPVALTVPANTLVIANTHGFHCRGEATGKCSRLEIYASSRTNPFNPLPGLGTRMASRVEYAVAQGYWTVVDRVAQRRGKLSSWHPVPGAKLHE